MKKLVLIDGNSLINRAFYATPPLSAKDGTPTNAVYAFINMLVKLIDDQKPEYILVAFDRREPTFRHKIFADYKGTRKPMPEDLRPQIDLLKKVLDTIGIARYEEIGIEADDIIGSMAKRYKDETIIITGDKDSFQLVDETTSVCFTRRGISDTELYSVENFKEKTGIEPLQIIDLKSMMGDSSDNIPGIAGVGEKTALSLVEKYGSLENLYAHTDELTGKLKEKVNASKDIAFLSKTLATINVNLDIPISNEEMKYSFPFNEETKKLFIELDFRNIVKRKGLFVESSNIEIDSQDNKLPNKVIIDNKDNFLKFDIDTILAITLNENLDIYNGKTEYVIKITDNFFDEGINYSEALNILGKLVSDTKRKFVVYGKKELRTELEKANINFNAFADDVSIEEYLADFSGREEKLEDVIERYGLNKQYPAYSLMVLHEKFKSKLESEGMQRLYTEVELPLCDVLFDMERSGFKIDTTALSEMSEEFDKKIETLTTQIYEIAGEKFNINSPKQLGVILFEKLGLKSGKKKNGNYSTSADILEKLYDKHEIISVILKYRQLQKLNSTYIKGFKPLIDSKTGLVHTCFNQTLTSTGRLSSKEPNLQNIPVREQEGKEIRKLFISSFDDGKIVGADYSQIELRLLAHFSGCIPLINAFLSGEDIHALTASQVFDVPIQEVTKEMRQSAKAVNFGIIYGISDFGLSEQLNISPKKAGEYIKKYFTMYPSVKEYMDKNVEFARKNGYVSTLLGRKRYIPDIHSANFNLRSFSERAAMNMPLQGTAADIIKIAMVNVAKRIRNEKLKSKLILQVHDELLVDTTSDEVKGVKKILTEEMEGAVKLSVPLKVETECGVRWFDAK